MPVTIEGIKRSDSNMTLDICWLLPQYQYLHSFFLTGLDFFWGGEDIHTGTGADSTSLASMIGQTLACNLALQLA